MIRMRSLIPLLLALIVVPGMLAQAASCPALVQTALQASDTACAPTGRNQACYGHVDLNVVAQPTVTTSDFTFDSVGDIEDVVNIQSLKLAGMDEATSAWGVVLMRLQANIPNTLPGQNVTFMLFGDVEITSADSANGSAPMQAFVLRTGFQDMQCEEAPQSGLLVQTPAGVGQVTFNVNGVDVSMGSTVFFQAQPGGNLKVRTAEGVAVLEVDNEVVPVIAGTESDVPMTDDLLPADTPSKPEAYDMDDMEALPLEVLEREVEIAPPADEEVIDLIDQLLEAGLPVCDMDGLPNCDELPAEAGGSACAMVADEAQMVDGQADYCDEDDYARFADEDQLVGAEDQPEEQPAAEVENEEAPPEEVDNSSNEEQEQEQAEEPPAEGEAEGD